jgi:hypothetical protein
VQSLNKSDALLALAAVGVAILYQGVWYVFPEFMALPLWSGSAIPLSIPLAIVVYLGPLLFAYLIVRHDIQSTAEHKPTGGAAQ